MDREVITVNEFIDYLGYERDEVDELVTRNAVSAIRTADAYLQGALGANYPIEDSRAKELVKIYAYEFYCKRDVETSFQGYKRRLISDLTTQLKLEMRSNE